MLIDVQKWDFVIRGPIDTDQGPTHVHECPLCEWVLLCGKACQETHVHHGLVYSSDAPEFKCTCPGTEAVSTRYRPASRIPGYQENTCS